MDMNRGNKRTITFKDQEHEIFYRNCLQKCRQQDVYHKALVYCLGISGDTRRNVERILISKRERKAKVSGRGLDHQRQRKGGAYGVQSFL